MKINAHARMIAEVVEERDGTTCEAFGPNRNPSIVAIHGYRESFTVATVAALLVNGQWAELVAGDYGFRDGVRVVKAETPDEEQARLEQEAIDEAHDAEAAYVYEYGGLRRQVIFEAKEAMRKFSMRAV
jgi:hypothetical protein